MKWGIVRKWTIGGSLTGAALFGAARAFLASLTNDPDGWWTTWSSSEPALWGGGFIGAVVVGAIILGVRRRLVEYFGLSSH
jgi:hypothetical protein